jgi:hypothetical protein
MRWLIYLHLGAVAICACFSLADCRLLWSLPFSEVVLPIAHVMLLPALIAWIVCPCHRRSFSQRSSDGCADSGGGGSVFRSVCGAVAGSPVTRGR